MSQNVEYIESHGQYIKSISLEVPNAPYIFSMMENPPEVEVKCNVDAVKINDNNTYEVTILISIEAKTATEEDQKKIAFICDLKYSGIFVTGDNKSESEVKKLMLVDAAFLLFPFARAKIADLVMSAGFPPLVLAPINFADRYNSAEGV